MHCSFSRVIKLLGIACICGVVIFSFTSVGFCASAKKWKVGVLRTEAPYAVEVEKSLLKTLKKISDSKRVDITILPTVIVPSQVADAAETARLVNTLLVNKPDILATIGTQASVPVWPIIKEKGIPMVFSGVTYPVEGKLIAAFNKPTKNNITGIGYAIPVKNRIEILRKIFSDTKRFKNLAFAYSSQVLQDHIYVRDLKALGAHEQWNYSYIDFFDPKQNSDSSKLLISKLKETKPDLVFGWFSLDKLGNSEKDFRALLEETKLPVLVVSGKFLDVGAIGGVLTDHYNLGYQQATMIGKIITGGKAGDIPPVEPTKYLVELNLKKARELNIVFDRQIIKSASRLVK